MPMRVLVVGACAAIAITAGLKAQAPDPDLADQLYTAIRGSDQAHDQWISSMATGWATAALATGMKDAKSIAVLR